MVGLFAPRDKKKNNSVVTIMLTLAKITLPINMYSNKEERKTIIELNILYFKVE